MRIVYVNGEFKPENEATVSVFDRGFLFADAVYEGIAVVDGKLIDFPAHIARLERSCKALDLPLTYDYEQLLELNRQVVTRNNLQEGFLYFQISRGVADRDFAFDNDELTQSVVIFSQPKSIINNPAIETGISVITIDDLRWGRCDIKTVQLLYPSLAKMEAKKQGADDAWFVKDGVVMEGTSNNAFIITQDDVIVTRPTSNQILPGITRAAILQYAKENQMQVEERQFTKDEAYKAKEAFISSATTFMFPVVKIDGDLIGDGQVGEHVKKLRALYIKESIARAI
ncbi:MAG: D-amino-acid transaminase [Lentilitoribacter sp.]